MANLNLSEFGENTSVSDADYTFVWDSAASISKKVSRNSWLNSGTLTSDAPVTISQTWGTTGIYTAAKVNVTETATANSTSRLLDLQLGGASKAYVDKNGAIYGTGVASGLAFKTWVNASQVYQVDLVGTGLIFAGYPGQFFLPASSFMGWNSNDVGSGSVDTKLFRDADNTLALRNAANAQTFRVYNTYSNGGVDFERLNIQWTGNVARIFPDAGGSGSLRSIFFGSDAVANNAFLVNSASNSLQLNSNGVERIRVTSTGNVGIGTTAPGAKLHITGGDNSTTFANATIALGFSTTGTFPHFIHTRHNTSADSNAFDFYTCDSNPSGVFPTNAVHGLTINNGKVGIGTTSPSSKLHVAETWNNAGTAFCAIKSVITDTASAAGSDFLELYSGTSTQPLRFDVQKTGQMNIYGAWTDTSNYERLSFSAPSAANAVIGTNKAGTGTARGLELQTDGVTRMTLSTAGALSFSWSGTTFSIAVGDSGYGTYLSDTTGGAIAMLRGGATHGIKANNYFAIQGGLFGWSNNALNGASSPSFGLDTALSRNAAGVVEINNGTAGTFRDLRVRSVIEQPPASITPVLNGDLVVEATSNTTLTFKLKGTDGTVRSGTITLSV